MFTLVVVVHTFQCRFCLLIFPSWFTTHNSVAVVVLIRYCLSRLSFLRLFYFSMFQMFSRGFPQGNRGELEEGDDDERQQKAVSCARCKRTWKLRLVQAHMVALFYLKVETSPANLVSVYARALGFLLIN